MIYKPCIYFVEGQCEEKLIKTLKEKELLIPGKVEVFNALTKRITRSKIMTIDRSSNIILVFDADREQDTEIFKANCAILETFFKKSNIHLLIQVMNLEDELLRSTDAISIKELTGSKSDSDFKKDFINLSDCCSTLKNHHFDINKMWRQVPSGEFAGLQQGIDKVILQQKKWGTISA